jgi:hypothetical protein
MGFWNPTDIERRKALEKMRSKGFFRWIILETALPYFLFMYLWEPAWDLLIDHNRSEALHDLAHHSLINASIAAVLFATFNWLYTENFLQSAKGLPKSPVPEAAGPTP